LEDWQVDEHERTDAARVLDCYPDIRKAVVESSAFTAWLGSLTSVEVDGEKLYLRGGDMLRDQDQVIFEWARRSGLLTEAAVARVLTRPSRN
jgi:hypothetical protein